MFFPFLRFLPMDADAQTRPEDAQGSVCPFLQPIEKVYECHRKDLPSWASKEAMGCLLMADKPGVCRLSPLGKMRGMVTGNLTYEYAPPARDCPACQTDVEVKVSDFLSCATSSAEEKKEAHFHKLLMSYQGSENAQGLNRDRFHGIVKQIYNIDGLLHRYALGTEHRPPLTRLMESTFAASRGNFGPYEELLDELGKVAGQA